MSGTIYGISNSVISYFGLKGENEKLVRRVISLEEENLSMKDYLFHLKNDTSEVEALLKKIPLRKDFYKLIPAKVINNSISQSYNYITIDKGANDGVKKEMGVCSHNGIVGIITFTSDNYALIQPILNPDTNIGCKIQRTEAFGVLKWEGHDSRYAYLKDYPRYKTYEVGDTVVTNGYSDMFPEGIMVGIVEDGEIQLDDNFYSLKIRLSTDFSTLSNVTLIDDSAFEEQQELENKSKNAKR